MIGDAYRGPILGLALAAWMYGSAARSADVQPPPHAAPSEPLVLAQDGAGQYWSWQRVFTVVGFLALVGGASVALIRLAPSRAMTSTPANRRLQAVESRRVGGVTMILAKVDEQEFLIVTNASGISVHTVNPAP